MARTPKTGGSPVDKALRNAFRTVETQAAPEALKDHVDQLTGEPPKPRRRS